MTLTASKETNIVTTKDEATSQYTDIHKVNTLNSYLGHGIRCADIFNNYPDKLAPFPSKADTTTTLQKNTQHD